MDHNATNLTVAGQLQAAPHGVTLGHGHGHEHAVVSHEGHNHLERRAAHVPRLQVGQQHGAHHARAAAARLGVCG